MARHEPPFDGIWPALLTPFDDQDRLNLPAASRLVARLIEEGAGGLYICGSSGEAPLLRMEERKRLAEFVISEVAGQIPIIAHVGHTSPVAAVELAEHAGRCGADAVSSVPPPFYRYTDGQVAEYWSRLSRASDLPFYGYVLHDLGYTGEPIARWLEAVGQVPTFAGLKFTHADTFQLAMLKNCGGETLNLFSGADEAYLACRAQGADGAIGTSYNVALPLWRRVARLYDQGDTAGATRVMLRCAEVVSRLRASYFNHTVKLVLRRQGIDGGPPRAPLQADREISEPLVNELVELIESQDLEK